MKSALFSGISAKKDDSSDDEKEKEKKKEEAQPEPVNEINLLDMDSGPSQEPAPINLLDTGVTTTNTVADSNSLIDVMGGPTPPTQPVADTNLTS